MTTYNLEYTKQNLDHLCDLVVQSKEEIIIKRLNKSSVALISVEELNSLKETLYLLSSPTNANRIFEALEEARSLEKADLETIQPQTIDELFAELEVKVSE
jgi:antitoxin YefM